MKSTDNIFFTAKEAVQIFKREKPRGAIARLNNSTIPLPTIPKSQF